MQLLSAFERYINVEGSFSIRIVRATLLVEISLTDCVQFCIRKGEDLNFLAISAFLRQNFSPAIDKLSFGGLFGS